MFPAINAYVLAVPRWPAWMLWSQVDVIANVIIMLGYCFLPSMPTFWLSPGDLFECFDHKLMLSLMLLSFQFIVSCHQCLRSGCPQVTCLNASRTWRTLSCGRPTASGQTSRSRAASRFCGSPTSSCQVTGPCSRFRRNTGSRWGWWWCVRNTTWNARGRGRPQPPSGRSLSVWSWRQTEGGDGSWTESLALWVVSHDGSCG